MLDLKSRIVICGKCFADGVKCLIMFWHCLLMVDSGEPLQGKQRCHFHCFIVSCGQYLTLLHSEWPEHFLSFGHSECNRVKEFAPLSNREVFYNHKNGVKGRDREPIHYQTPHIVVSLLYMYMVTSLQTVDSVETLK